MNRLFTAGCLIALIISAGSVAKADDFKGVYAGVTVGDTIGRSDAQTSTVFSSTGYFATTSVPAIGTSGAQRVLPTGFTGSGLVGYNFLQSGNIVLGAEADFGAMRIHDFKTATATYPCCAPTTFTVNQQVSANWLLTARPRLGYTWGRMLMYVTAGLAVTHVKYQALFTDTFATALESAAVRQNKIGWTVGGGAEYQFGMHWSVKAEYLYADFGRMTVTSTNLTAFTPPIAYPVNVFTHSADLHAHIARAGFNWRF